MTQPDERMRVVSLLPAATEIVCALGFRDSLVGRSHECDHPGGVERLPVCSRPRLDPSAPGVEVHREVEALLAASLSIFEVDTAALASARPDLVVTQTQCEVCAVSEAEVVRALGAFAGGTPRIASLSPSNLASVFDDIRRVAAALGAPVAADSLIDSLESRLKAIRDDAAVSGTRPTVATIEWIEPLMTAGNWMPELIETAGGRDLLGTAGAHSGWLSWPEVVSSDPDVLLVCPCGFDLQRTRREAEALRKHAGFADLRAVRDGAVYLVDGHRFFNRPGPRLVESAEILAEILHPDRFDFGHEGDGWSRM